jgi:hypothetical protein
MEMECGHHDGESGQKWGFRSCMHREPLLLAVVRTALTCAYGCCSMLCTLGAARRGWQVQVHDVASNLGRFHVGNTMGEQVVA